MKESIKDISFLFSKQKGFDGWVIGKIHFQTREMAVLQTDIQTKIQEEKIQKTAVVLKKNKIMLYWLFHGNKDLF